MKRHSLRMVDELSNELKKISKELGISMNSLMAQTLWEAVLNYRELREERKKR